LKPLRKKKQITYKAKPFKITADFSIETLKARKAWSEVFQALKENSFNFWILNPEKPLFKIDGGVKVFHNKQKLKQYMTTKLPLQKFLKGIPHMEDKIKYKYQRMGNINLKRRTDK
jgi:hypothetical protein